MSTVPAGFVSAISRAARDTPGLELLVLFGSRARGDARPGSDWDFGFQGDLDADVDSLLSTIVETLNVDTVDLVDLRRASGLLRFRVARDGQVIFERRAGVADGFRLDAASFWCDVEPVLRRGYERVLARLSR